MNNIFSTENLTLLLSYPFKDPAWKKKLLIGMMLMLLSCLLFMIPSIFIFGYGARIAKKVADEGGDPVLPEWDDWGGLFVDGLRILVVCLVVSLPVMVFILSGFFIISGSTFLPALFSDPQSSEMSPQLILIPLLGMLLASLLILVGTVFSLVTSVFSPAIVTHVAVKKSIAALFKVGDWWSIWRANMSGFFLCLVFVFCVSFAFSIVYQFISVLAVLCCPLYFVVVGAAGLYLILVFYALYAQVYRQGVLKLTEQ